MRQPIRPEHDLFPRTNALEILDITTTVYTADRVPPDFVQCIVEDLTIFFSFWSIPFVVYFTVLISGLLIGLGPGAVLLAGTASFLVCIPMIMLAFPIFAYRELARVIRPR
jgi:hypothetical protein